MENVKNLLEKDVVSSSELIKLLEARSKGEVDFLLIDVREDFEYQMAHIDGVDRLLPTSTFQSWAPKLLEEDKDKTIIFTCRTDNRSGQVANILRANGLRAINHLGGIVSYGGKIVQ